MNKYTIKDWSEDDRPREKLLTKGCAALSDAELLAIIIGSGTREKSAVDLSKEVLKLARHNFEQLGKLTVRELQEVKGIGEARAITIVACLEIGRRRQIGDLTARPILRSSEDASVILVPLLQDYTHEVFCVLYLTQSNALIKHELVSVGGLSATVVDVRVILKNALLLQAVKLIVAHNHPSGNLSASDADKKVTQKLKAAAHQLDIELLDHIIVAQRQVYSFADNGLL